MRISISVIVPVYNCEKHLKQCLDSLKKQILDNIEFIIVNDGSTDNSKVIIEEYRNDPRFIVLEKENGGVSSARNYGMRIAKGSYIGFVDADDWVDNNMFSEMFLIAENNNFPDIVHCNYVRNQNERISYQPIKKGYYDEKAILEEIIDKMLSYVDTNGSIKSLTPYNWIRLYKRSLIENNNIQFDERISNGEDRLFSFEAVVSAKSYFYLGDDCTYYHYRYLSNSQSVRFIENMWKQRQLYIDNLIRIAEQTNNDSIVNQVNLHIYAASNYCLWNALKKMNPKNDCINRISEILCDSRQQRWLSLGLDKILNKDSLNYYKYFLNKNAKALYNYVWFDRKKKRYLHIIHKFIK